jgi:hypothetical protein
MSKQYEYLIASTTHLPHASMPIRQAGKFAKNSAIWSAPYLPLDDGLAILIYTVQLKHIFRARSIPECCNLHLGRSCLFKWLIGNSTLAHYDAVRAGVSIPLLTAHRQDQQSCHLRQSL